MVPWVVIVAPKGLPDDVRKKLSGALESVMKQPAVQADMTKAGLVVNFEPGSAYAERVAKELPLLKEYVKKANIPVE